MPTPTIDYEAELKKAERRIAALLSHVGNVGLCRGCHVEVVWVRHTNGKLAIYDLNGESHFATCPMAEVFRGKT